jgi:hypothetical protein
MGQDAEVTPAIVVETATGDVVHVTPVGPVTANVIVPVGFVPVTAGVTVAVNVTVWSVVDVATVGAVNATVVAVLLTVIGIVFDDGRDWSDPLVAVKVALME